MIFDVCRAIESNFNPNLLDSSTGVAAGSHRSLPYPRHFIALKIVNLGAMMATLFRSGIAAFLNETSQ